MNTLNTRTEHFGVFRGAFRGRPPSGHLRLATKTLQNILLVSQRLVTLENPTC